LGRHTPHAEFTVATTLSQLLQHAACTQFDAAIVIIDNPLSQPVQVDRRVTGGSLGAAGCG
jgi:hypothetical protein